MNTYHALYLASLEATIEGGGTPETVEAAIRQYNVFDPDAFDAWLKTLKNAQCVACGVTFEPEGKTATTEILCVKCTPR